MARIPATMDRVVLLVEDDESTRTALGRHLADAGYHVVYAANGWEALLILDRQTVHLIILDLVMPGMDGQTFLKIVRNGPKFKTIPVIVTTAFDAEDMR